MPDSQSKNEQVLNYLYALIAGIPDIALLERNAALPMEIKGDSLMIMRDGSPGDVQETLGGFDSVYMTYTPEIEVIVQGVTQADRDQRYNAILKEIGDRLVADRTFSGLIYGFTILPPRTTDVPIAGAAPVKAGIVSLRLEYESPTALG